MVLCGDGADGAVSVLGAAGSVDLPACTSVAAACSGGVHLGLCAAELLVSCAACVVSFGLQFPINWLFYYVVCVLRVEYITRLVSASVSPAHLRIHYVGSSKIVLTRDRSQDTEVQLI